MMRPPFLFLPAGEKETRICALRAALRAVALRNAAAAGRRLDFGIGAPFGEYHSFVGDAPPSSFSPYAEKKKSAVHGGEEKEGFGSRLGGSRPSILLHGQLELYVSCAR